ncbi:MAG: LapA family protein [Halioglobus sp.]
MNLLRKILVIIIILATVGVGVLFALQNTALVPLDVLVYRFEARSLALWVLLAFAVGGVSGMLTFTGIVVRQRGSLRSANRHLAKARTELDNLRTAGLKSSE